MTGASAGKRALITGGASGIGLACAREFAARGAHVVVADLDVDARRVRSRREVGGEAWLVDLADTAALDDLSLDVDILVNNAGIQRVSPIAGVRARGLPPDAAAHGRVAVPAHPRGAARHVRAGLGPGRQHLERARPAGEPVQVGLRRGQARARGPLEGHRARGRPARRHEQLHQPRLRAHARSSRSRSPTRRGCTASPRARCVEKIMLTETAIKRLVEPDEVASLAGWLVSDRRRHGHRRLVHDGRRMDRPMSYSTFTAPVATVARGGQWDPDARARRRSRCTASPRHRNWDLFAAALRRAPVIAPDLRGRGRSNTLPAPYGARAARRRPCGEPRCPRSRAPFVVGHSMGAFVSVRFAERHPDRSAGLGAHRRRHPQCRDTQGYSYAHDDRLDQGGPDGGFGEDLDEVVDARPLTRSDARPVRQRRAHQVEDREAEEDREDRQPGQQHGHCLPGRPGRSSPPARYSYAQQSRITHAARGLFAAGTHSVVRSLFDGDLGAAELEPGGTTGS